MGQYSDLFEDDSKKQANIALRFGVESNPDESARAVYLAKRYNLPPGVVKEFKPDYETQAKVDDGIAVLDQSPKLRSWLAADPVRAELSHDDLANLGQQERTIKGFFQDIGTTALKATIALPQAAVGIANIPTFGYAGKAVEAVGIDFKRAQEMLSGTGGESPLNYSPAQQAANRRVESAQGFGDTIEAMIRNPSTIATTVGESSGLMLGGMGIGRMFLSALPKVPAWLAAAMGEGAIGAGAAAEQTRSGN